MGTAETQGELWSKVPREWATLQEPMHAPLWEAMLDSALVNTGTRLLDAGTTAGGGPFELSAAGVLEGLFEKAGLKVIESREVDCPFSYPDFETFWRAMVAAGPAQGMLRIVGEKH